MRRWLVALAYMLISDKYEAAACGFGLAPDSFLGPGDEWRDKNSAIGGCIKPLAGIAFTLGQCVSAMNHHLFTERVVQQLKIAVRLISLISYFKRVYPSEKLWMRLSYRQTAGIIPDIAVNSIERACTIEETIIEIILENRYI